MKSRTAQSHQQRELSTMSGILDLAYSYQRSKILLTACELDVFSIFGNESKTAKEISHEIDTDERATERLLNALCAMGLLNKKGGQFSNNRGARWYLVKESPDYIGNLMHLTDLWDDFGMLTHAVKEGQEANYRKRGPESPEVTERAIAYQHSILKKQAPEIVQMLNVSKAQRVLDLGCGSGAFAIEFAKANPKMEIFVFDSPDIIPYTESYIEKAGMQNHIEILSGDFLKDDSGFGYDIVFLSSYMHRHSLWDNIYIASKVYRILKPSGQIAIYDYILNDDRTLPEFASLFSLEMLLTSLAGETYTQTDMWIILKEAWFREVKKLETPYDADLILGQR